MGAGLLTPAETGDRQLRGVQSHLDGKLADALRVPHQHGFDIRRSFEENLSKHLWLKTKDPPALLRVEARLDGLTAAHGGVAGEVHPPTDLGVGARHLDAARQVHTVPVNLQIKLPIQQVEAIEQAARPDIPEGRFGFDLDLVEGEIALGQEPQPEACTGRAVHRRRVNAGGRGKFQRFHFDQRQGVLQRSIDDDIDVGDLVELVEAGEHNGPAADVEPIGGAAGNGDVESPGIVFGPATDPDRRRQALEIGHPSVIDGDTAVDRRYGKPVGFIVRTEHANRRFAERAAGHVGENPVSRILAPVRGPELREPVEGHIVDIAVKLELDIAADFLNGTGYGGRRAVQLQGQLGDIQPVEVLEVPAGQFQSAQGEAVINRVGKPDHALFRKLDGQFLDQGSCPRLVEASSQAGGFDGKLKIGDAAHQNLPRAGGEHELGFGNFTAGQRRRGDRAAHRRIDEAPEIEPRMNPGEQPGIEIGEPDIQFESLFTDVERPANGEGGLLFPDIEIQVRLADDGAELAGQVDIRRIGSPDRVGEPVVDRQITIDDSHPPQMTERPRRVRGRQELLYDHAGDRRPASRALRLRQVEFNSAVDLPCQVESRVADRDGPGGEFPLQQGPTAQRDAEIRYLGYDRAGFPDGLRPPDTDFERAGFARPGQDGIIEFDRERAVIGLQRGFEIGREEGERDGSGRQPPGQQTEDDRQADGEHADQLHKSAKGVNNHVVSIPLTRLDHKIQLQQCAAIPGILKCSN